MQPLKDKILEGFFANVGADPFINWINEVFRTSDTRYCNNIYFMANAKDSAESDQYIVEYKVVKAGDKSLLIKGNDPYVSRRKQIIINIPEIPELLNIKPDDMYIHYVDNDEGKNIQFLFGQLIRISGNHKTLINNILLTIDRKTGTIMDKEVIPKFLISEIPF